MKYKAGHFLQIPRGCFQVLDLKRIKTSTKWLYMVLNELEHRFTGRDHDTFYRSIADIAKDSGLSRPTVINGLRELEDLGLVTTRLGHLVYKNSGKKTNNQITYIRIVSL